jgi:hypothetical protein
MHLLAEHSVAIDRPAEAVFDYVADMERFGDWFPGVIAIESANARAHGEVGKEYVETVAIPLRGRRRVRIAVREARPGECFVTEGSLRPLMPRMEVGLRRDGPGRCELTWRMLSRNDGALFRLTLLPMARAVLRRRAAHGLARLKRNLERVGV